MGRLRPARGAVASCLWQTLPCAVAAESSCCLRTAAGCVAAAAAVHTHCSVHRCRRQSEIATSAYGGHQ
ncbi:hypothetical protein GW17_00044703 [Ensete ventricosum]|nr:hypothetical protein GW17_00044703 [Ensete ventricosum]